MMSEPGPPVAPLVEDVLNGAHNVAAAGLEMDARVDAALHAALLRLVHAVYAHQEALELQRELEADGVREAHVFEVTSESPPPTSYPAHVERIITAAIGVAECAAAPAATTVAQYALAPLCTLVEAVSAYRAHATAAIQWQAAGNRLALLVADGPDDTVPPPSTSCPRGANPSVVDEPTGCAADPGEASDSVALGSHHQDELVSTEIGATAPRELRAAPPAARVRCR